MVGDADCRPILTCVLPREGLFGVQSDVVDGEVAVEVAWTSWPAVTIPAAVDTSVLLTLVTATLVLLLKGTTTPCRVGVPHW